MSKDWLAGILLMPFLLNGFHLFHELLHAANNRDSQKLPIISQTPNHAPIVHFIQPLKNAVCEWNSQVPFLIEVSDPEDGESKYQEIQSSEVLVKLKYAESNAKAFAYLHQKKFSDSAGVMSMLVSNCFNCHAVKTRLAGPSFQDICKRYLHLPEMKDQLVYHIQKGSTGTWGKEVMPSHPELADTVTRQMVDWILNFADNSELNFVVGLQGILPLHKPETAPRRGLFIVTAYYTDHGSVDFPDKRITGSDQVIIKMK